MKLYQPVRQGFRKAAILSVLLSPLYSVGVKQVAAVPVASPTAEFSAAAIAEAPKYGLVIHSMLLNGGTLVSERKMTVPIVAVSTEIALGKPQVVRNSVELDRFGIRLRELKSTSFLYRLGFRQGDVITAVNGNDFTKSVFDMPYLISMGILWYPMLQFDLERQGQPLVLVIDIKRKQITMSKTQALQYATIERNNRQLAVESQRLSALAGHFPKSRYNVFVAEAEHFQQVAEATATSKALRTLILSVLEAWLS